MLTISHKAAIDTLLYLPALALPFMKKYKGYLAPLAWIFSYLWLTAFIFAVQDYSYGKCGLFSPTSFGHCGIKKTLAAFSFLALYVSRPATTAFAYANSHDSITSLVATALETRLYDVNRHNTHNTVPVVDNKHVPATTGAHPNTSVV